MGAAMISNFFVQAYCLAALHSVKFSSTLPSSPRSSSTSNVELELEVFGLETSFGFNNIWLSPKMLDLIEGFSFLILNKNNVACNFDIAGGSSFP